MYMISHFDKLMISLGNFQILLPNFEFISADIYEPIYKKMFVVGPKKE